MADLKPEERVLNCMPNLSLKEFHDNFDWKLIDFDIHPIIYGNKSSRRLRNDVIVLVSNVYLVCLRQRHFYFLWNCLS